MQTCAPSGRKVRYGSSFQLVSEVGVGIQDNIEPVEMSLKITAALDYANASDGRDIREHYLWTLTQITDAVGLADLTTAELVTLTALLIPAHSRVLAGRGLPDDASAPGKVLRLVRDDSAI